MITNNCRCPTCRRIWNEPQQSGKMQQSFAEFLNIDQNQAVLRARIIGALREKGEWGKRGLFTSLGKEFGFTAAYIGQVFNGNKPIRENFAFKMAEYLGVTTGWLR